jgi:hypothetical protein
MCQRCKQLYVLGRRVTMLGHLFLELLRYSVILCERCKNELFGKNELNVEPNAKT